MTYFKKLFLFTVCSGFFLISVIEVKADVGQQANFKVNSDFDRTARTSLSSTLRYIGEKAYYYVEDNYWNGLGVSAQNALLNNISLLSVEFDSSIYPKETEFWGSEPNPGIDNDPKMTILLEELIEDNGGYVDIANGYSIDQVSNSNQREMISLNIKVLASNLDITKMFLAHEFQHWISFNQKEKTRGATEDVWLNETRAEYSVSLVGYNDNYSGSNLERRVYAFSKAPNDSLTEWPNQNIDYATAVLFGEYLVEQFGRGILAETLRTSLAGINSIDQFLISRGYLDKFKDIFLNWLGALYLNDIDKNPKLGYQRAELRNFKINPQQTIYLSSGLPEYFSTHQLEDWQPLWLEFDLSSFNNDQTKSLKLELFGERGQNFAGIYLAIYSSGKVEKGKINFLGEIGTGFIPNRQGLQRVVVLTTKTNKISNFGKNEPAHSLGVKASVVESREVQTNLLEDGVLIKRPREKEIYVIWGKYKRYLTSGVVGLYGHLDPANAIELEPEVFDSYQTSNYVKYVNDEKVYAVWPDGSKHWLNITPRQWDESYRDWNAIFTINELELNFYRNGVNITR